jgi:signal transduction histidine kinase
VLPKQSSFRDFEVERHFPRIGRRTLLLNGRSMEGAGGSRVLLSIEDVTERKKEREDLRALNDNLEARVTERTSLAEARTEQLHDLASELTRTEQRERERLARLLHDDLQQLLVGALFHLGQLRTETTDPGARLCVDQVEDLIRQSISSSRSLTAELSPTILYEAGLGAALPWLARQMKLKHGLDVRLDINANIPQDDEGVVLLLFQAVRELLFNIVKHAQVKEARVQVDRLEGDLVRIVVSDDGAGFEPSRLEKKGPLESGMGLFGIRERINYVGGTVAIDSAPGRGARVTLTARVRKPEDAAQAVHAGSPAAPAPAAATGAVRKIRVLLVDDHKIMRQGLAGILRQHDDIEIVAEAADGKQAVEEARRRRPDVIIMDISMPEMNGIEATRAIHAELPDVRIIGLSMHEEADGADAMREAGASAYLSKDGPSDALIAAVRAR